MGGIVDANTAASLLSTTTASLKVDVKRTDAASAYHSYCQNKADCSPCKPFALLIANQDYHPPLRYLTRPVPDTLYLISVLENTDWGLLEFSLFFLSPMDLFLCLVAVAYRTNQKQLLMESAMKQFVVILHEQESRTALLLRKRPTGLFYFNGHGAMLKGLISISYLESATFRPVCDSDPGGDSVIIGTDGKYCRLQTFLNTINNCVSNATIFIILDCCRDDTTNDLGCLNPSAKNGNLFHLVFVCNPGETTTDDTRIGSYFTQSFRNHITNDDPETPLEYTLQFALHDMKQRGFFYSNGISPLSDYSRLFFCFSTFSSFHSFWVC